MENLELYIKRSDGRGSQVSLPIYKLVRDKDGVFWGFVPYEKKEGVRSNTFLPTLIRDNSTIQDVRSGFLFWLEFNEQEYLEAVEREKEKDKNVR